MGYVDSLMKKFDARQKKIITSKWALAKDGFHGYAIGVVDTKDVVCRCESEEAANHIVAVHNATCKPVTKKPAVKAKKPVRKK